MDTINLSKYCKSLSPTQATKVRVFSDFFCKEYNLNINDDINIFILSKIDEEFIIRSLEFYIIENKVTTKATADNYVTYVVDLLKYINEKFQVRSIILQQIEILEGFILRTKEITSKLHNSVNKDIATDDEYASLKDGIESFFEEHKNIQDELNDELDNLEKSKRVKLNLYESLISIISIKMILQYAIKSNVIIRLKVQDVDMVNKKLHINGLALPLNDDLASLISIYSSARERIVKIHGVTDDILFLKYTTGKPYTTGNNSTLLMEMIKNVNSAKAESFAAKRILEMLEKEIDISIIAKMTDWSIERCVALQSNNIENDDAFISLQSFLSDKPNRTMICSFCREKIETEIDNWVIIQFKDSDKKFISCRGCKGLATES